MPVPQGNIRHILPVFAALLGNNSDTHTGSHKILGSLGSIHPAADVIIVMGTAGPPAEAVVQIVVEGHLGFPYHFLRLCPFPVCQGMVHRNSNTKTPFPQLPEMKTAVPVGGIHDGHVQLFLAYHVHQLFRGAFCHMEADTAVAGHILPDLPGHNAPQHSRHQSQADHHRGVGAAFLQDHRSGMKLLQSGIHLLLEKAALFRQTDVPSGLFKKLHAAQVVFQIVNGAA